jgi:DNA-binding transcriptional MocR family regulator
MDWVPTISPQSGPLYRQIAEAIEGDIVSGRLRRGQQLPTHRALAQALGIDLTTVTRAYAEARGRGLLEGRVGQGTFVSESSLRPPALTPDVIDVDLSMNVPPQPAEAALDSRIAHGLAAIERRAGFSPFLNYHRPGGGEAELEQAVRWLAPRLVGLSVERMAIFPGSQSAIFSVLRFLCRPGDRVLTEALTFPGFRSAAQTLGLTVAGVAMDGEGAVPDALAKAIRAHRAKAVYLTPTMHNPSTATMSARRRWDIAQILRRAAIPLIEDDAYGLLDRSQDLIATLIPDQTFVTTSLSKCLTPGLRVSFLTAPDAASATGLRGILQSIAHIGAAAHGRAGDGMAQDRRRRDDHPGHQEGGRRATGTRRPHSARPRLFSPPQWAPRLDALAARLEPDRIRGATLPAGLKRRRQRLLRRRRSSPGHSSGPRRGAHTRGPCLCARPARRDAEAIGGNVANRVGNVATRTLGDLLGAIAALASRLSQRLQPIQR